MEAGTRQVRDGLSSLHAAGAEGGLSDTLALQAEAYGNIGQAETGWLLAEALQCVENKGERYYEAEIYRLKGELMFVQSGARSPASIKSSKFKVQSSKSQITDPRPLTSGPHAEAEACFLKAIEIARQQQAKSFELRAVMSLVRLQQQQAVDHASRTT